MNDGFMSFEPENFGFRAAPRRADRVPTVRRLSRGHEVVLSDEGFLGNAMIPEVGWVYRDAGVRAQSMLNFFGNVAPFQLVLYLRPQHVWLESLYSQRVKWGWITGRIDPIDFAQKTMQAPFFRWTRLVEALLDSVGSDRLIVRPHVAGVNVTQDFLSVLNLKLPPRLLHQGSVNVSPTPQWVALMSRIWEQSQVEGLASALYWANIVAGENQNSKVVGKASYFPEDVQNQLIETAASDWAELAPLVRETKRGEPVAFLETAKLLRGAQPKPYLGALDEMCLDEEATHLIAKLLPYVRSHPRFLPLRLSGLARRAQFQLIADPKNALGPSLAYVRRRIK